MSENTQAPEAPANAVEASPGVTQGESSPTSQESFTAAGAEPPTPDVPEQTAGAPLAGDGAASEAPAAAAAEEGGDEEQGDADEQDGASTVSADAAADAGAGDPNRKKRRRRRRKKGSKPGEAAAAPGTPEAAGEERPHAKPPREGQGGVFARFFDSGHAGKRHAFAPGEVVAGRVAKISDGAFAVDLFGKAMAFVDIYEPHEVPVMPEPPPPPPEPAPSAHASAGASAPGEAEAADAAASVQPVEGPAAEPTPGAAEDGSEVLSAAEAGAAHAADASLEPPAPDVVVSSIHAVGEPAEVPAQAVDAAGQPPALDAEAALAQAEASETGAAAHGAEAHAQHEHEHEGAPHDEAAHDEAPEEEPAPPPPPDLGTIFRGRIGAIAESGHVALVNRIIDGAAAKARVLSAREKRRRVRGVVFGFNRGGFDVLVEGIRVFCPASGMSLGPLENPDELLGQRLEFTVPPVKAGTHGLVVSRRGILERQQRKAAKQLFRSLTPGQRLKGRVTQIREFGLFVDLGGIEGLVHQSELSFSRGVRPQDAASVGQEVDVQVLRVGEGQTRKERERVSLSMKALQDDPWSAHGDVLEPGAVITGKVVRTTEFGAFIEIAAQIEGLLHISELGRELKHANQTLTEGQDLRVVVERVDRKARRISLSKLSQAEEKALEAGTDVKSGRPPKPGQQVTVVVDKVEHAGLVVQVPGVFGRRGRGFIPNSEMGTERGTDHRKGFPPGTQIPAKVVGVDRDGGFRFSRKALMVEEEKRAIQDYRREAARQGLGTFGDLLRKKLEGGKG
jgi:small subunit ribosomal protein S1